MRRFLHVLACLTLLVVGCDETEHDRDYKRADKTPLGLHVEFWDYGTISTGLMSKLEVYEKLDKAFLQAGYILGRNAGLPLQVYLATPHDKKLVFVLIDHWHYYSVYNGWVRGEASDSGTILLSFWNARLKSVSDHPSNPWTVDTEDGIKYFYGYDPGRIDDLVAHEMGHVFFGPSYGHLR
jgi:hypothetical protein